MPTGKAAVWNAAVPAVTPTVARAVPPSSSCTCPVGVPPVTLAVKLNVLADATLSFATVSLVDVETVPPPPPPPPGGAPRPLAHRLWWLLSYRLLHDRLAQGFAMSSRCQTKIDSSLPA